MKKLLADVVEEATVTSGTGTVTLTQVTGWARFSDRFANGDLTYYSIRDGNNWEIGIGTVGASHTLARTTIIGTLVAGTWTSGGSAMTLSGGQAIVRSVAPEALYSAFLKIEQALVSVDTTCVVGKAYGVQASNKTMTLPSSPTAGDTVMFYQAAASITGTVIDPGAENINGNAGTMSVDLPDFSFWLVYIDSTHGWKVIG